MNTKKLNVVVTGATGYIGSQIVKALVHEKMNVYIIKRKDSDLTLLEEVKGNIKEFDYNNNVEELIYYFKEISRIDVVVHIASLFLVDYRIEQLDQLICSNIQFGTHLLEAMKQINCKKFINTSTSWQHYQDEEYNPVCLYAAMKESFEKIVDYYVKAEDFSAITLELFDTYGIEDPRHKVLNLIKECALKDIYIEMSPGDQELECIYIEDVINAYKVAIELLNTIEAKHIKYSITSNEPRSLKEIVRLVEQIVGKKLNIQFGKREYRSREVLKTWKRGNILPGWEIKYKLEDGLRKLLYG